MSGKRTRPAQAHPWRERIAQTPPPANACHSQSLVLWVLFILLIIYPLGLGPASWLGQKVPASARAIDRFFGPVQFVCDSCPPVSKALYWYVTVVWRGHYIPGAIFESM